MVNYIVVTQTPGEAILATEQFDFSYINHRTQFDALGLSQHTIHNAHRFGCAQEQITSPAGKIRILTLIKGV